MLMPSMFADDLFDEFMREFPFYDDRDERKAEKKLYGKRGKNLMKTDIKEFDNGFELEMDLPGFKKEEMGLDEEDRERGTGRYIRRER